MEQPLDYVDDTPYPRFSEPRLAPTSSDGEWYLTEPMYVEWAPERVDVIPTGFVTDLATVPWFARWVYRTWGKHTRPSIWHDWMLRYGRVARVIADRRFRDGLIARGCPPSQVAAMYAAVRANSIVRGWFG